jgi:hypothetical protein
MAKAGNYSLSLETVPFKFWFGFLLLLLFNFENKTKNQPFVDGTH